MDITGVNWVAVTNDLPPYDVNVMLWDGHYPVVGYRYRQDSNGDHWRVSGIDTEHAEWEGVTHWARLPEGPAKEPAA